MDMIEKINIITVVREKEISELRKISVLSSDHILQHFTNGFSSPHGSVLTFFNRLKHTKPIGRSPLHELPSPLAKDIRQQKSPAATSMRTYFLKNEAIHSMMTAPTTAVTSWPTMPPNDIFSTSNR